MLDRHAGALFPDPGRNPDGTNTWTIVSSDASVVTLQSEACEIYLPRRSLLDLCSVAFWLTFFAFAIKLPLAPLHTWLPDAHVEAPTPISMILAGVSTEDGWVRPHANHVPFLPRRSSLLLGRLWPPLLSLASSTARCVPWHRLTGKRLVAYSSVSHMGYVALGVSVMTRTAFDGAYYQMIGHGISSAMMFFLVGVVYERAHHRDLNRFGGLWLKWPGYGGWSLLGFFAGMGLPGLCGFIGEIMVLLGTFEAAGNAGFDPVTVYTLGILAASGVVLTAGYILWMFQRVYMGTERSEYKDYAPVNRREYFVMATLGVAAICLWRGSGFGLSPDRADF